MSTPRLLLLGSSPANLLVIEALARRRLPPADVVLIAAEEVALYGPMVPGCVEGRYEVDRITVPLRTLCASAGAGLVSGRAATIDAGGRSVSLQDGSALSFDFLSIALPGGMTVPPRAHSTATLEQLNSLITALDALAAEVRPEPRRVVVLGAGELGIELALCIRARLDRRGANDVIISVFDGRSELFGGRLPAWSDRVERELARRDIGLKLGTAAAEIGADFVRLSDGRVHPSDITVWTPGPHAQPLFRESGLPLDGHGVLLLDDTLQVPGRPELFATGVGTALMAAPRAPQSEASSLRMGRVLVPNLAAVLGGRPAGRKYHSSEGELTLLNAGGDKALLLYGPVATAGHWAMRMKRWRDRGILGRFRASGDGTGAGGGS